MAFLRKRIGKRGVHYYIQFENHSMKAVGSNLAVARRILAEYHDRSRLAEFGINDPVPCSITLGDLLERDLEQARREAKDVDTRLKVWKSIQRILPMDMRISELTPGIIERLDDGKIKRATLRRRYAQLRYQLAESVRLGEIAVNPFVRVRRVFEHDARAPVALTLPQIERLLLLLVGPTASHIEIQFLTASRPGEIGVVRGDVLVFPPHKRGVSRRFHVPGRLAELLASDHSFSRRFWERGIEEFGIPIHQHDIRHSALTIAGSQPGASLVGIMRLGGWKSPAMASRYLHSGNETLATVSVSSESPRAGTASGLVPPVAP